MKPNITFLKTRKYNYLYDGNTGYIMRIDPAVESILTDYADSTQDELYDLLQDKYTRDELDRAAQQIATAKEQGLLAERPEEIFLDVLLKQIPYTYENCLSGVCLAVTQQCNLRCQYCTYSGIYGKQNRAHSDEVMSFETAKKAIDYTIARSTNWDEYHLTFYGGEPLTRFAFVKQCIEYIKSEYPGKKLDFNITTNGTLLTEEKLAFLVEHQVRLYISIDGPAEYHDEYRKYVNQKGSFQDIKTNLLCIQQKYPEYYYQKVNFGITVSPFRSLEVIERFVAGDELFYDGGYIRISGVSGGYEQDIYVNKRSEEVIRQCDAEDIFINLRYLVSKVRGDKEYLHKTRVVENFCESVDISDRRKVVASKRIIPAGPCTPGARLFVTTDGEYVICEKANETGFLKLGNVDEGLDVAAAQKILKDYFSLTEKECLNCWAYLNCGLCPVQVEKDGELSRTEKLKQCEHMKRRLAFELTLYLAILEKNPLAFGPI